MDDGAGYLPVGRVDASAKGRLRPALRRFIFVNVLVIIGLLFWEFWLS